MASHTPDSPATYEVDEISLADIMAFVRKYAYWIVGLTLIGLLAGVGFAWVSHKQWQADSILQIGQIQYADHGTQPVLLEPVAQTVARIQSRPFQDALLKSENQNPSDESSPLVRLLRKTLSAKPIPNTTLVQLSVRGFSPEQAKALLQTAQNQLIEIHTREAESILNDFRARLAEVNKELADNAAQLSTLNAAVARRAQAGTASKNGDDALLLGLLNKATEQRQDLTTRKNGLEEQLNPNRSFISKPMGDITVPTRPVYPRPALFAAVGLVLGLFIGCAIGLLQQMRQVRPQA